MKQLQILKIFLMFKVTYPEFMRGFSETETNAAVEVWENALQNLPETLVFRAVQEHTEQSKFAPKPADIVSRVRAMRYSGDNSAEAHWKLICKAASRGLYNSLEEFLKLPLICQLFVGDSGAIHRYATADLDTEHERFVKEFDSLTREAERIIAERDAKLRIQINALNQALEANAQGRILQIGKAQKERRNA